MTFNQDGKKAFSKVKLNFLGTQKEQFIIAITQWLCIIFKDALVFKNVTLETWSLRLRLLFIMTATACLRLLIMYEHHDVFSQSMFYSTQHKFYECKLCAIKIMILFFILRPGNQSPWNLYRAEEHSLSSTPIILRISSMRLMSI